MKQIAFRFVLLAAAGFLVAEQGHACFQNALPAVRIRSRKISGTVLGEGKPMMAIDLALRPANGFFFSGYHPRGPALGWVESDENGRFSFPDVPPGSYVIVGAIQPVRVDVVRPSPSGRRC